MKRIIAIILTVLILCVPVSVSAEDVTVCTEYMSDDLYSDMPVAETVTLINGDLGIEAKSCVLMEPNALTVLYESNAGEKTAPASITKIMALVLIFEAIDSGRITLDTDIVTSAYAASMGGSQIWLKEGEVMTLREMLKAIVIASANDATVAVGETLAGSEENFVKMMNTRAAELGMDNTNFQNCTGLDAEGHYTTAYDVALMSCELLKHKGIEEFSTVWMDELRGGKTQLVNTNKLVRFYDGCVGLKTGTTSTAGCCLSAAARRDETSFVAVVMGGKDSNARFTGARKMLDFGFANYQYKGISAQLPKEPIVDVAKGKKRQVGFHAENEVGVLLNKTDDTPRQSVKIYENITAPVKKNDVVGIIDVLLGDEVVGNINLLADEDVEKNTFFHTFLQLVMALY